MFLYFVDINVLSTSSRNDFFYLNCKYSPPLSSLIKTDIKFSVHNTFLELPTSGMLKTERLDKYHLMEIHDAH